MLENILRLDTYWRRTKKAHALLTQEGNVNWAETAGELGRFKQEAAYTARLYRRFLKMQGIGLVHYLGRDTKYLLKHLRGVGSARYQPEGGRIVAAMVYMNTNPDKRYIISNGYGGGFSEGLDTLMGEHNLPRSETLEYVLTEETTHLARPTWSESRVAESMFRWYMHRADKTKNPGTKERYMKLAEVANDRYKAHCKLEGKRVRDLGKFKKPEKKVAHGHNGHGDGHGHDSHNGKDGGHHVKQYNGNKNYSPKVYKPRQSYTSRTQSTYRKAA